MTKEELLELLSKPEDERIEWTRAFDKADKIGQAVCSFANDLAGSGEPGYLLLGVKKDGSISGRRVDDQLMASLGGLKTDGNLLPPPSMAIEKISLPEGDVVAITVYPSRYPPIRYAGQVWIRVGPRKSVATEEDVRILQERRARYGIRDEELPCETARLSDLDLDLFRLAYLPKAVDARIAEEDDRPVPEQMAALKFFNPERNCPTNLGVLLFAKHPERFIPSAYVQYVKFAGDGVAGDILQETAFRGPLVRAVQELDVFVKTGPGASRPVPVSAMREEQRSRSPASALRELVLNAIVHRDYFLGNAPTKFYEYSSGRIEIVNPGGLFGRARPDNFPRVNDYRNPLLAEAMKILGFVNKFSRGVSKVQDELAANGNPRATFDLNHRTEFRVTVLAAKRTSTIRDSSEDRNKVLEFVRNHPGVKRDTLSLELKIPLRTLARLLKDLGSVQGPIEYRGTNRSGGWYVRT